MASRHGRRIVAGIEVRVLSEGDKSTRILRTTYKRVVDSSGRLVHGISDARAVGRTRHQLELFAPV
ncbi:MAG: hypothetical protein ACKVII_24970, partial [Planctomycetales bacterium]